MMRLFFILLFSFIIHQNGWGQSCYNPDIDQDGHINTIDLLGLLAMYDQSFVSNCIDDALDACDNEESLLYNGYYYDLVSIGNQCWFAENLRTLTYQDGSIIFQINVSSNWGAAQFGAFCINNNNYLYNAYVVNNSSNVCPTGWRVPTEDDFMELAIYVDPDENFSIGSYSTTFWDVGQNLKSNDYPNWEGLDLYGFNGIPTGKRSTNGNYMFSSSQTEYWTSTVMDYGESSNCCNFTFGLWTGGDAFMSGNNVLNGNPIRCLKN